MATVYAAMPMDVADANVIKHQYVMLNLHPNWITQRPVLAVNKFLQCSYNGSDWHGSAIYRATEDGEQWEFTFNWSGDMNKMKILLFEKLKDTDTFLHLNTENKGYNAILIPFLSDMRKVRD